MSSSNDTAPVVFTAAGFWRGMRICLPMVIGQLPFGLITGMTAQAHGLSLLEATLMSGLLFAGNAQLPALGAWTIPAPFVAATLTSLIVNMRFMLMGPLLAPWLDHLRGWRRWGSLFFLVEMDWALALQDIKLGKRDAAFFMGIGATLWVLWVVYCFVGFLLGAVMAPAPGHPVFFAIIAAFIALLVPMWRGKRDLIPWIVAGAVAVTVAQLMPGTPWYILAGALSGGLTGYALDQGRTG